MTQIPNNQYANDFYTITKNIIDDGENEYNAPAHHTVRFRLSDGDDEVYFEGLMVDTGGTEAIFTPLDRVGASYGCVTLEVMEGRKWVMV